MLLRDHGWELRRHGEGDHEIWYNPEIGRKITLDRGARARGAALSIVKKAGIKANL